MHAVVSIKAIRDGHCHTCGQAPAWVMMGPYLGGTADLCHYGDTCLRLELFG